MLKAVWSLFRECYLDLSYCYGIGADGASANQGQKGGFIKLFLDKLHLAGLNNFEYEHSAVDEKDALVLENKLWIPNVWCTSHVTALGASAGNRVCDLAAELEKNMKEINSDFTCSAPRIAALTSYQQMLAATREKFLTITPWHECR